MRFLPSLFISAALCGTTIAPAQAALNRVWLSSKGADASSCGAVASPCRTLRFALLVVAASGEIDILDGGDYGPANIRKSVNIVNDGAGTASITPDATQLSPVAMTINLASGVDVHLRGLELDGTGFGGTPASVGVQIVGSDGSLEMVDCIVRNFDNGILFDAQSGQFSLINSVVSNNGAGLGLVTRSTTGSKMTGVVSGSLIDNNTISGISTGAVTPVSPGPRTNGVIDLTVVDSVVSNNVAGIRTTRDAVSLGQMSILLRNVAIVGNGAGVALGSGFSSGDAIRLSQSTFFANGTGVGALNGATVSSFRDNTIDGNATNLVGALTAVSTK